jgi:hypothetical protein
LATATPTPGPRCQDLWPIVTIHTLGKHPVPNVNDNPKVSHSITGHIVDPGHLKETACRIRVCPDTTVTATIEDSAGPGGSNTSNSANMVCVGNTCSVTSIRSTEKYTARSADGSDTDRMIFSITSDSRKFCR